MMVYIWWFSFAMAFVLSGLVATGAVVPNHGAYWAIFALMAAGTASVFADMGVGMAIMIIRLRRREAIAPGKRFVAALHAFPRPRRCLKREERVTEPLPVWSVSLDSRFIWGSVLYLVLIASCLSVVWVLQDGLLLTSTITSATHTCLFCGLISVLSFPVVFARWLTCRGWERYRMEYVHHFVEN
ncbi:hypothetical protein JKG47_01665 [Acidithiobacillus sp. MC6.1]|nr:hypothetical protein [Acidithiobacillus sp. MC6.1]